MLGKEELVRYARHLNLPQVGQEGQLKLKHASVLVVGAGGLGSPALLYLAAAGVGTIGIIDHDTVDESNLQRQIIHGTDDVEKAKVDSAKARLLAINPLITVKTYYERLTADNARDIFKEYDVVIDGTDNFSAKYVINDACYFENKPLVYGAIFQFMGQLSVFNYENGPCYRCLAPNAPPAGAIPNCATAGVLGVLPGVVGTMQATEAIKIILGQGSVLSGRFLVYDALQTTFSEMKLEKNPSCALCGTKEITSVIDVNEVCATSKKDMMAISVHDVKKKLDSSEDFEFVDVRNDFELQICQLPGAKHVDMTQFDDGNDPLNVDKSKEIILFCHTDNRSYIVAEYLKKLGYSNVKFMRGGVVDWSREIDSSVAVY